MKVDKLRRALPYFVFLSGASALIYESLWMRSFGLIFGNTTHAVAAILAVFMGGVALGSFLTTRVRINRPARAYALVEMGIGCFALISVPLLRGLPQVYGAFIGAYAVPHSLDAMLRIAGASLILLPPTVLLGMTFPLVIQVLTQSEKSFHANLGSLYLRNTLGGAFGVFIATFVLMPMVGKLTTFIVAAVANLTISLLTWIWGKAELQEYSANLPEPQAARKKQVTQERMPEKTAMRLPIVFLFTAFSTGLCSFGLEVLWTRSLALVVGSSIYSFNIMLIALLLGIVTGTFIYESCWGRIRRPLLWLSVLTGVTGVLCLINVKIIGLLPVLFFALIKALPITFFWHQLAAFSLSFAAMFPVTVAFGLLFPLLTHLLKVKDYSSQEISGHLYAWNTLGAIIGALGTAFFLVPLFGLQSSFLMLAFVPFALGIWFMGQFLGLSRLSQAVSYIVLALVITGLSRGYRPWNLHMMTAGIYKYGIEWRDGVQSAWELPEYLVKNRKILFYREGDEGVVCVTEEGGGRFLSVNGKTDASNGLDVANQKLIAHVPLMLHPKPDKTLVIGWGSGCTVASAGLYTDVKQMDCIEIEPAMFDASQYFPDLHRNVQADPRLRIHFQDGRNYMLTTSLSYDVVLSEPSNPWITGVSNLFTQDFYSVAKSRLNRGGVFCQWFHYYNMSLEDVKVQSRTFAESFPYASMWLVPPLAVETERPVLAGDLFFVGSNEPMHLDYERISQGYRDAAVGQDLRGIVGMEDELAFLCSYLMNRDDMLAFGKGVPLNTDDTPRIEFSAPKNLSKSIVDSQAAQRNIYRSFDEAATETLPPVENYPPLLTKNIGRESYSRVLTDFGRQYLRKAVFGRARRLFQAALREDDANAEARALLGETLYQEQSLPDAERHLLAALSINPKLKKPYFLLGKIYHGRRDYEKAAEIYDRSTQMFPDDPVGFYELAAVYAERRDWTGARDLLHRSLSIARMQKAIELLSHVDQQIK